MNRDALPLERVFLDNNTCRVLDLLTTHYPFEYTYADLITILTMNKEQVRKVVRHLVRFGLVQRTKRADEVVLSDNPRTLALRKFIHETAVFNIEQIASRMKEAR